jgi:MtN3 and saliva related transmembrane protein
MEFVTIIGFLAATITTVAFLPQTIKTLKTKQTKDISLSMYIILAIGILLWFAYGIYKNDWPIILANGITFIFILPVIFLKIMGD